MRFGRILQVSPPPMLLGGAKDDTLERTRDVNSVEAWTVIFMRGENMCLFFLVQYF